MSSRADCARAFALAALLLAAPSLVTAEVLSPAILSGPGMRLAGNHTFTFSGGTGTVTWSLDRETVSDTGVHTRTNGIASRSGTTATFSLAAVSGSETFYYVHATAGAAQDVDTVQVFPADTKAWFTYHSAGNPDVRVYVVVPSTLGAATRVLLAMHGDSRTASSYADTWRSWATLHDYLVLCPYYDDVNWPTTGMYQMGNVFSADDCGGVLNPESRWTFTIDLGIHARVRDGFMIRDPLFDLWGFSGGGQHVHRFMLFEPDAPVRLAIAAGSGWYTVPDDDVDCPYGPDDPLLSFTHQDVLDWTNRNLVIMVGTADTLRDPELRVTARADAEGLNRYERAGYMMSKARAFNPLTRWRRIDVVDAGHESKPMAAGAQDVLLAAVTGVTDPPAPAARRSLSTLRVQPNPFAREARLSGEGWADGEVSLEIYDLAGRRVVTQRVIASGGTWRSGWSALTPGRTPTGMYLVRARQGERRAERKVLVLE